MTLPPPQDDASECSEPRARTLYPQYAPASPRSISRASRPGRPDLNRSVTRSPGSRAPRYLTGTPAPTSAYLAPRLAKTTPSRTSPGAISTGSAGAKWLGILSGLSAPAYFRSCMRRYMRRRRNGGASA